MQRILSWICALIVGLLLTTTANGQTVPQPLRVTRLYNVGTTLIDNRSALLRQNNYHSFCAVGTGSWTAQMSWSESSAGPWTDFGSTAYVDNNSASCVGSGFGYHAYVKFTVTGVPVINYSATKDFYVGSLSGSGTVGGGVSSINGLTTATQTFSLGTTGQAPSIVSSGALHTFNFPSAAADARGLLTSTDWTTFNSKVPATRSIFTDSTLTGGGDLSLDRTLSVVTNTTRQKVNVLLNGTLMGTRSQVNFGAGASVSDDPTNDRINIDFTGASGGISTLGGQTGPTQGFATGTTGADFNIVSSVNTHTFNLPNASATTRGALSSTDWSLFNGKVGTTRQIIAGTGLTGGGDLSANRTLTVAANTTTQKVEIALAGTLIGTRKRLNFSAGTIVDDAGNDQVNITVAGAGGGSTDFTATVNTGTDVLSISSGSYRFGHTATMSTQVGTATSPAGTGTVYFYLTLTGGLTAGLGSGVTSAGTLENIATDGSVTGYPFDTIPVAQCSVSADNWVDPCTRTYVSGSTKTLIAGTNVTITKNADGSDTIAAPVGLHAPQHATGGSDPLTPAAIGAEPVDATILRSGGSYSNPSWLTAIANSKVTGLGGAALLNVGTIAGTVAAGDDSRMTNPRTPTAHAASHATAQSDALTPSQIGAEATVNKGQPSGYAPLETDGLISASYLPAATGVPYTGATTDVDLGTHKLKATSIEAGLGGPLNFQLIQGTCPAAPDTGYDAALCYEAGVLKKVTATAKTDIEGLIDPGANGIVKRTAANTTAAASAGTDYYAPGGAIASTDLPNPTVSAGGKVQAKTCGAGQHVSTIGEDSTVTCTADSGGSGSGIPRLLTARWSYIMYFGSGTTWTQVGSGTGSPATGTVSAVAVDATNGPTANILSAATTDSASVLVTAALYRTGRNLRGQALANPVELTGTARTFIGFTTGSNAAQTAYDLPTGQDYMGFRYTAGVDTNWQCIAAKTSAPAAQAGADSGVAVAAVPTQFEIINNDTAGTTTFWINGSQVCSGLTTRPKADVNMYLLAVTRTLEAVAKNLHISFLYAEADR